MHLYSALLEHRHGLPVRSVAVLLSPKANLSVLSGQYERRFPGEEPYDVFRYQVVRVWELPVEGLLAGGLGTLPLAPISAVAEGDVPAVIARMKQRLTAPDAPPYAEDLWTATYVLMGMRYERAFVHQMLRGVIAMEESVTYQAIVEEGVAKGERQGARRVVRLLGTRKFGEPPADLWKEVEAIHDLGRLEQLLLWVEHVASWHDLLAKPG